MAIKDIMGKFRSSNEYLELDTAEEAPQDKSTMVEVERLEHYTDADRLQKKVREGSIILVNMKELKKKDTEELKRAVEKLKRTCLAVNGDIAGLTDDWLVVTPAAIRIQREGVAE
jgi:SepF-like predicted cell division protein (DUF552 family)